MSLAYFPLVLSRRRWRNAREDTRICLALGSRCPTTLSSLSRSRLAALSSARMYALVAVQLEHFHGKLCKIARSGKTRSRDRAFSDRLDDLSVISLTRARARATDVIRCRAGRWPAENAARRYRAHSRRNESGNTERPRERSKDFRDRPCGSFNDVENEQGVSYVTTERER